ncbi:Hypothetical protein A7982_11417 [Minicystis rosea]|nr:Hypothetical protein A7982_11417 [Minicystis rosea]
MPFHTFIHPHAKLRGAAGVWGVAPSQRCAVSAKRRRAAMCGR